MGGFSQKPKAWKQTVNLLREILLKKTTLYSNNYSIKTKSFSKKPDSKLVENPVQYVLQNTDVNCKYLWEVKIVMYSVIN